MCNELFLRIIAVSVHDTGVYTAALVNRPDPATIKQIPRRQAASCKVSAA